jgi:hypothetical protein
VNCHVIGFRIDVGQHEAKRAAAFMIDNMKSTDRVAVVTGSGI